VLTEPEVKAHQPTATTYIFYPFLCTSNYSTSSVLNFVLDDFLAPRTVIPKHLRFTAPGVSWRYCQEGSHNSTAPSAAVSCC